MGWDALAPSSSPRWVISKRVDLAFVIGSAAAGYLLLGANLALGVPLVYLWWIWSVGFDGTHIFGTASRTFFDTRMVAEEKKLLFGSLGFFFAFGPLMVLAGWKSWLALLVAVWAYYHVVRQHYGFLMLYKVKNADLEPQDNRLDSLLLYTALIFPPFHRFFVHHPEELGLPESIALAGVPGFEPLLWTALAAVGVFYIAQLRQRRPVNVPKLLLLAAVIPLHWLTFELVSWRAAVPVVTIVHNLQYHAIIWFHNRNRYGTVEAASGPIPRAVGRSLVAYIALALVFSALYRIPGYELGRISDLAFGFFCGFGLTHYYLDSKIWSVRGDHELRRVLKLS